MFKFTPSSYKELDIKSLRIALVTYILSKQAQDIFLYTVDDTKETEDAIDSENIDILKKFAINTEQTIYRSKNKNIYQNLALKLLEEKKAFICFCDNKESNSCSNECFKLSKEEINRLKNSNAKFNIRVKRPSSDIIINDKLDSSILIKAESIEEFAILDHKTNASETFASAVDNMLLAISMVVRDKENLDISAKEIYILNLLDYKEEIEYLHLPNLLNCEDITIKSLFKQGFLPDAIINYILAPIVNIDKKIFYLPEAINSFNIKNIQKNSIEFNIEELKTLNRKHLQLMDSKKLSTIFGFADSNIGEIAKLFLNDASTINELIKALKDIFSLKECNEDIKKVANCIKNAPMINDFNKFKKYISTECSLDEETTLQALRVLLTGSRKNNIKLDEIYKLINPYLLEVAKCQ